MITFTTRNRPKVLEYSLSKTREVYDGEILVIDDNSETRRLNESICAKYDTKLLYNERRLGIPRSKDRGFNELLSYDFQYWFDDDCYPKAGWLEKIQASQQIQPHLLYLKEWAHICKYQDFGNGVIQFTGASVCFMAFSKEIYPLVHGFADAWGFYGGWHHTLSLKLGGYYSIENASDYLYSFDLDGTPQDFGANFGSSLPPHERIKKLKK